MAQLYSPIPDVIAAYQAGFDMARKKALDKVAIDQWKEEQKLKIEKQKEDQRQFDEAQKREDARIKELQRFHDLNVDYQKSTLDTQKVAQAIRLATEKGNRLEEMARTGNIPGRNLNPNALDPSDLMGIGEVVNKVSGIPQNTYKEYDIFANDPILKGMGILTPEELEAADNVYTKAEQEKARLLSVEQQKALDRDARMAELEKRIQGQKDVAQIKVDLGNASGLTENQRIRRATGVDKLISDFRKSKGYQDYETTRVAVSNLRNLYTNPEFAALKPGIKALAAMFAVNKAWDSRGSVKEGEIRTLSQLSSSDMDRIARRFKTIWGLDPLASEEAIFSLIGTVQSMHDVRQKEIQNELGSIRERAGGIDPDIDMDAFDKKLGVKNMFPKNSERFKVDPRRK